jgi:hypothetical protein
MEEAWTLWCDESREGGDKPLVAVGLLLHADADDTLSAIRWEIEHALPWVPWPLHATELHRPGMHLAWMSRHIDAAPVELRAAVDACANRCRSERVSHAFSTICHRTHEGRSHRDWFDACGEVEAFLSASDSPAWEQIVEAARVARRWLQSLLMEAARRLQSQDLGSCVASTDSELQPPLDLMVRARLGRRQTEWKEVVTQLAVRSLDLLSGQPTDAMLQLSPLAHRSKDADTGAARTGDASSLLDAVSQEVTENRTGQANVKKDVRFRHAKTGRVVTLAPAAGHAYNVSSPVAHVWSDWLAYELRSKLRRDLPLDGIATRIRSAVAWSVLPLPGIVTITASGPTAVLAGALRRGLRPPDPSGHVVLAWAEEQAELIGPRAGVWRLS